MILKRGEKYIAPSILSANFLKLEEDIKTAYHNNAEIIHFDVMDGNFVPNISFGIPVLQSLSEIKKSIPVYFDAHLMIEKPERYIKDFSQAGADMISFHIEATYHPYRVFDIIKKEGKLAGVAMNPGTSIESIYVLLDVIDFVLVMTVNPGFGGQRFIEKVAWKISKLDKLRKEKSLDFLIEVDGGLNSENVKMVADLGADILVFGSFMFSGNIKERIKEIRESLR